MPKIGPTQPGDKIGDKVGDAAKYATFTNNGEVEVHSNVDEDVAMISAPDIAEDPHWIWDESEAMWASNVGLFVAADIKIALGSITSASGTISFVNEHLITTGTIIGGGAKVQLTPIGGIAVKLTNTTGANTIAGQIVKADTTTDDAVILTTAGDVECIGVFLDSGVADDAEAWVVVAGIADVAMQDNTAATHGNWVETSDAEAGYANATAASPAAAPAHFEEIGLCIESVAAGGGGTHILARCILHFN